VKSKFLSNENKENGNVKYRRKVVVITGASSGIRGKHREAPRRTDCLPGRTRGEQTYRQSAFPAMTFYFVYLVKLSRTMFKKDPFMKATSSELLMRNFNEIFIELDPLKRAAMLAESYTEDCLWIHLGGRIVGRERINEAATEIRKHFPEYRYTVTSEIQIMQM
jgi:hypothetical protein